MEPIKLVIFVAAFLLLLVIGRKLSRLSETSYLQMPPRESQAALQPSASVSIARSEPVPLSPKGGPTGAEIGFPFPLPEIARDLSGKFNRPYFTNYYFENTDLILGPPEPRAFFDAFFLQAQEPEDQYTWTYHYTVATPDGLAKLLEKERFDSVYFDNPVVIVSEWDLPLILQTITDEVLKNYGMKPEEKYELHPEEKVRKHAE
ncbi:MAG TPA: hypothetical protein VE783_08395 [Candidatus Limnocylindrales bacterium]|nr:hypothetical protein [Candidatus Limnocylindrales bacterium]